MGIYETDGFCEHPCCDRKADYCIQWDGLNQHGENPEVVSTVYSCSNPGHLIELSDHPDFGGYPDYIWNLHDRKGKPRLLKNIKKGLDDELDPELVEKIFFLADPPKELLKLPF